jgi:hypothetical protein
MLSDTIDKKYMNWIVKNYAILWVQEFSKLTTGKAGPELTARLPGKLEDKFIEVINQNQEKFDSLWSAGVLSKKILGEEDGVKFKTEADSALSAATNMLLADYKIYSVHIVMPGKLIRTNGYIDSARRLFWPVNPDLFFCDTYEMWAESKTPNIWAWVVSGLFLLFVFTGIILKQKK